MAMGPERWKQQQFARPRRNADLLVLKLGCAALMIVDVIQVPDRNQLAHREFVAAAIDVPVIELTRVGTLYRIAIIFKGTSEKRIGLSKLLYRSS